MNISAIGLSSSSITQPSIKPHKIPNSFNNLLPFFRNLHLSFNLRFQTISSCNKRIFFPLSSIPNIGFSSSEFSVKQLQSRKVSAAVNSPAFHPTPPIRELRTPHSGYHFDGSTRQFFEGWYFKVSIPEKRQSFCFIYSIENPAFCQKLTPAEEEKYGRRFTGVGVQILGANDKYLCQFSEDSHNFWARRHELVLGNTFKSTPSGSAQPPTNEVFPEEFNRRVSEGFQVTPFWNQGFVRDDGRSDHVETAKTARWEYSTRPVCGWGNVDSKQKSTAGWLAAFPVFEPHWQICMAGGLSTGWIEWDGERYEFEDAPSYSEKNWGAGFPRKWFWLQCNVFEGLSGEVSVTSGGGLRQLPGGRIEDAALVAVHYEGVFYEFVPWNGSVAWEIAPWGYWKVSADNGSYQVELEARTEDPGAPLRAPIPDKGLTFVCNDNCSGQLTLRLWERRSDGSKGKVILEATSNMAAVEVGGGPWTETWKGRTTTPAILSAALKVPIDMKLVSSFIPFYNPPGL